MDPKSFEDITAKRVIDTLVRTSKGPLVDPHAFRDQVGELCLEFISAQWREGRHRMENLVDRIGQNLSEIEFEVSQSPSSPPPKPC